MSKVLASDATRTAGEVVEDLVDDAFGDLWAVVVLNDDVTTFTAVIRALMDLFDHSERTATSLAWKVHQEGRARVAVGDRAYVDAGVLGLHERGIGALREPV